MSYLEEISLTTRLFHSNDLSEMLDAICEVERQDQDASTRAPLLLVAELEETAIHEGALQAVSQINAMRE